MFFIVYKVCQLRVTKCGWLFDKTVLKGMFRQLFHNSKYIYNKFWEWNTLNGP